VQGDGLGRAGGDAQTAAITGRKIMYHIIIIPLTGPENATIHTGSATRACIIIDYCHIIRMDDQVLAVVGQEELKIVTATSTAAAKGIKFMVGPV
jgi:hypothetical protein